MVRIRPKRGTSAQWNTVIPANGEFGYDASRNELKIGNGVLAYPNLPSIGTTQWVVATSAATMLVNTGYITNTANECILTLPTSCKVGDMFYIVGNGTANAGTWRVAQNANQRIVYLNTTTSLGTGGYLRSANNQRYNTVTLVCIVANTTFAVVNAVGTLRVT